MTDICVSQVTQSVLNDAPTSIVLVTQIAQSVLLAAPTATMRVSQIIQMVLLDAGNNVRPFINTQLLRAP